MPDKKELRKEIKTILRGITDKEFNDAGKKIFARILSDDCYKRAKNVFCFVSMKSEPQIIDFLKKVLADGKGLYLPKVTENGMIAVKTENLDLIQGAYGIYEPRGTADTEKAIDLAVIPCLAMSVNGSRLGHGGGYYDRFLQNFGGDTVAVCMERFVFPKLPTEAHDMEISKIATEDKIIDTKKSVL